MYGVLRNFLAPQRPKDKSFDELARAKRSFDRALLFTNLFVDSKTYKSKNAFETAPSTKLANKEDVRDVIATGDESVNKVGKVATPRRPQGKSVSCFRRGKKHAPSECWCKAAQCYRCKKVPYCQDVQPEM